MNYLEGPMQGLEDFTPRVKLMHDDAAHHGVHELHMPRVH
jgi:hypothetical protein